MEQTPIEVDYFVIGAGASAMAFVDTLLSETDAKIAMVDRHHKPGGHWIDAYSFVGLHQPSAFYGVNSRELSSWTKDKTGLNEGLYGLASGAQVLSYFDQVMHERFLPSGRVMWFPKHEYRVGPGGHQITSLLSGDARQVAAPKKIVNATHTRTEATHPPKYTVAPDVKCVPLNGLPDVERPYSGYTLVGAGKTGMDACIWLLQNGVDPERIRWIMPRDAWLLDRANFQPGAENFGRTIGGGFVSSRRLPARHRSPISSGDWKRTDNWFGLTLPLSRRCIDAPSFPRPNSLSSVVSETLSALADCTRSSRRGSFLSADRTEPIPTRSTSTAAPPRFNRRRRFGCLRTTQLTC